MKYKMPEKIKKMLNTGECISSACYIYKYAAACNIIAKEINIKYEYHRDEAPSGKDIFIFYFFPKNYREAFRLGRELISSNDNLFKKKENQEILDKWKERFKELPNIY